MADGKYVMHIQDDGTIKLHINEVMEEGMGK
jgi:hypothetical protein